jgi:hypothetical protein
MAFKILVGKGENLPIKLRITIHLRHKIPQIGIRFSPSIGIHFKFGFSQDLEDHPIYNFPIHKFESSHANF